MQAPAKIFDGVIFFRPTLCRQATFPRRDQKHLRIKSHLDFHYAVRGSKDVAVVDDSAPAQ